MTQTRSMAIGFNAYCSGHGIRLNTYYTQHEFCSIWPFSTILWLLTTILWPFSTILWPFSIEGTSVAIDCLRQVAVGQSLNIIEDLSRGDVNGAGGCRRGGREDRLDCISTG